MPQKVKPISNVLEALQALKAYDTALKADAKQWKELAEAADSTKATSLSTILTTSELAGATLQLLWHGMLGPVLDTILLQLKESPTLVELLTADKTDVNSSTVQLLAKSRIPAVLDDIADAMNRVASEDSGLSVIWKTMYSSKSQEAFIQSELDKFRQEKPFALPAEIQGKLPTLVKASKPLDELIYQVSDSTEMVAIALRQANIEELHRLLPEAVNGLAQLTALMRMVDMGLKDIEHVGGMKNVMADLHNQPKDTFQLN